ncbi:MAG: conjugal transfer protein TrbL family protein [Candidatus Dormiibacterota bacterium]
MIPIDPTPLTGPAPGVFDPSGGLGRLLFDPANMIQLVIGLIDNLLAGAKATGQQVIESYFLWTGNFSGNPVLCNLPNYSQGDPTLRAGCRFTDNNVLRGLYALTSQMANAALVAIVVYSLLRSIWERGYRARYTLKAVLPKLLLVIALVNFGLPILQGAIDLNNGAVHAFWSFDIGFGLTQPSNLWDMLVMPNGSLLVNFLALLTAVLLLVLAITSIARNLLLVLLIGGAPLAFLCVLLPETHTYLYAWRRLFFTAVFMQAVQVLVLRLALVLLFEDRSPISVLYGLLAMYLVLRVPGALHASSKAESRALMWAKHGVHAVEKMATATTHHPASRVRAHPAAD